jgi:hypothetical protein
MKNQLNKYKTYTNLMRQEPVSPVHNLHGKYQLLRIKNHKSFH